MPCDSAHWLIERKLKFEESIYLPLDSYFGTTLLNYGYFLNFKNYGVHKTIRTGKKCDPENKALQYNPEHKRVFFKLRFDD